MPYYQEETPWISIGMFIVSIVMLFIVSIVGGFWSINFDRKCSGYLKRAADANTVELAARELDKAIQYMERNELTKGVTSVLYYTPDEDIGWLYENLKKSANELADLPSNATPLEKSNMLMKLRETLLDHGDKGSTSVTMPPGIHKYPYNVGFCAFNWFFGIILVGTGIRLLFRYAD